jgi:hypothetical protein
MKTLMAVFILLNAVLNLNSQGIKGYVTDCSGQALPNATIYIQELSKGTITNIGGQFEIALDTGQYQVYFHSIGFFSEQRAVQIQNNWEVLNIGLKPRSYEIEAVTIGKSKEDPAYPIMRKAIALAPYHKNQVDHFQAKMYLKGNVEFNKVAKFISKNADISLNDDHINIASGDKYVMESYSELKFEAPSSYQQKTITSKNSLPIAEGENMLGYITASLYDPKHDIVVSPLAPQAFTYYRFRYEGYSYINGHAISKIRVVPKRKGRQVYSGHLYIVDGLWCLQSVDLSNKSVIGPIKIRQVFQEVETNIFLPISHNLKGNISFPGLKVDIQYIASLTYEEIGATNGQPLPDIITLRHPLPGKQESAITKPKPSNYKLEKLMEKEELNKRDMIKMARLLKEASATQDSLPYQYDDNELEYKMIQDTIERDSIHWDMIRPLPLNTTEIMSYEAKDSMLRTQTMAQDTAKNISNQNHDRNFWLMGFLTKEHKWIQTDTTQLSYAGALKFKNIGFNTVDGFYFKQNFHFSRQTTTWGKTTIQPYLAYAFSREALMWEVPITHYYSSHKSGKIEWMVGDISADYKGDQGIHPFINMFSSLLFKENPLKLYRKQFIALSNQINLKDRLPLFLKMEYLKFSPLNNNTPFAIFSSSKKYSVNLPGHERLLQPIGNHRSFVITGKIGYDWHTGWRNFEPTRFSMTYKTGIEGMLNGSSNFGFIEMEMGQVLKTGLFTQIGFGLNAGAFLNHDKVYFYDFKHFNTIGLPVAFKDFSNHFMLVPDYKLSTDRSFVNAHAHLKTPYIILKYLPWVRNRLWKEDIYVNMVSTPAYGLYWEAGYALTDVFQIMDLGVFAGFNALEYTGLAMKLRIAIAK